MKKMSESTKDYLRNGFGSLVSNKAAIEAGKTFPWWVALIIFIVFSFIPVTPLMNNVLKTNGSDFIRTNSYSFDKEVAASFLEIKEDGGSLTIDSDKYISYNKETPVGTETLLSEYLVEKDDGSTTCGLRVYYIYSIDRDYINNKAQDYAALRFIKGTLTPKSASDPEGTLYYAPNVMIIAPIGMSVQLYKFGTEESAGVYSGDWQAFEANTELVNLAVLVNGTNPTLEEFLTNPSQAYLDGTLSNWKFIFDTGYATIKHNSLLISTFLYWGIYAGLVLFLGLLVFLLTRGKKNFNNYLKWYQCLSISAWASTGPSVLALILGFIFSNFAMIFFIMFLGIRVMWLTMKQLSPTYQG